MKRIALLLLLPFLAACGSLAVPEPATYGLAPAADTPRSAMAVPAELAIEVPHSLAALDSSRIAFVAPDGRQTYFRNVAWADRAPAVIADDLVRSFQASGMWRSAELSGGSVRADYLLQEDLTDCEAFGTADGKADHVKVGLTLTLVRLSDQKPVGSMHFQQDVPVADTSFDRVIAGFNIATNSLAAEAIAWTRRTAGDLR